jgi:hypothetical protein
MVQNLSKLAEADLGHHPISRQLEVQETKLNPSPVDLDLAKNDIGD